MSPVVRPSKDAVAVFNVPDASDNLRLECLRLAASLGGTPAEVLAAAEAFFVFLRPRKADPKPADLFPEISP